MTIRAQTVGKIHFGPLANIAFHPDPVSFVITNFFTVVTDGKQSLQFRNIRNVFHYHDDQILVLIDERRGCDHDVHSFVVTAGSVIKLPLGPVHQVTLQCGYGGIPDDTVRAADTVAASFGLVLARNAVEDLSATPLKDGVVVSQAEQGQGSVVDTLESPVGIHDYGTDWNGVKKCPEKIVLGKKIFHSDPTLIHLMVSKQHGKWQIVLLHSIFSLMSDIA